MTKYIPQENADVIAKLINTCKSLNPEIIFKIYDTECLVYKSKNADTETILNEMDGGDEELGINCYIDGKCCGWFGIMPYEDTDSVIYDYSDNEFTNRVMEMMQTSNEESVNEKNYQLNDIHLTDNEIEVLKSATCENGSFIYGFTYEIQVYNYTSLSEKVARGVLSSLVKKGILNHKRCKYDGLVWNHYTGTKKYVNELEDKFSE